VSFCALENVIYTSVLSELCNVDINAVGLYSVVHSGTFSELWKVIAME
jgi:hypothetical protein